MINLIPKSAHRAVIRTYWVRVLSIWSLLVTIVGAIIVVLLIPSYILIAGQLAVYSEDATAAASQIQDYDTAAAALVQASQQASFIRKQTSEPSLLATLTEVEELASPVVAVSALSARRTVSDLTIDISISGVAPTRQALVQFNALLEESGRFTEVVPGGSLIQENDIPFTLSLTVGTSTQSQS